MREPGGKWGLDHLRLPFSRLRYLELKNGGRASYNFGY
jgi:hypothetical protein